MSADNVAALVAAITSGTASLVLVGVVIVLGRRVRELGRTVDELRRETVPLVHDARVVVDQAATEMVRVGDVLDSAEAVSSTVDSASRLAYRAFSNPVVKILAYSTGTGSALRRFFGRPPKVAPRSGASSNGRARPRRPPWSTMPGPTPGETAMPAPIGGGADVDTSTCRDDPPPDVAGGRRRARSRRHDVDAPAPRTPVPAGPSHRGGDRARLDRRAHQARCGRQGPRRARHGPGRGPASSGRPVARPVGPRPRAALKGR